MVPGWLHVVVGGIKFYHFVLCHSALFFLTESFSNTFGSKKGGRRFLDVLPDGRIACTTPDPDASGRRRAPRYLVGYVEGGRDSVANARRAGTPCRYFGHDHHEAQQESTAGPRTGLSHTPASKSRVSATSPSVSWTTLACSSRITTSTTAAPVTVATTQHS